MILINFRLELVTSEKHIYTHRSENVCLTIRCYCASCVPERQFPAAPAHITAQWKIHHRDRLQLLRSPAIRHKTWKQASVNASLSCFIISLQIHVFLFLYSIVSARWKNVFFCFLLSGFWKIKSFYAVCCHFCTK